MIWEYEGVKVLRLIDADTVDARVPLTPKRIVVRDGTTYFDMGFRHYSPIASIGQFFEDRFRLWGIDAWEPRGEERAKGVAATAHLAELLDGADLTFRTFKDDSRGKFGRWLCEILATRGNKTLNLNDELVRSGHAVEYSK